MKKCNKLICLALLACLVLSCLAGCTGQGDAPTTDTQPKVETVDYVSQLKLDMNSDTKKLEVTVKSFIDGDTIHCHTNDPYFPGGVLKARFLAVDTPESTGRIEEYGKQASRFTKETLSNAVSIIVESDDDKWNADSTGSRFMSWIWYQPSEGADYRLLNLEILQNGLAVASNTANNRYGNICMNALDQAKAQKLNVHSGKKDPEYYYGEVVELTLKELRANINTYEGIKVGFSGVVTMNDNNTIYVEQYDAETDMYYGMSVYLGFNLPGAGLEIVSVGNEAWIVGTVQYYENGGTWQVSGLSYRAMAPNDPSNLKLISTGNTPAYVPTDPAKFASGKVTLEVGEEMVEFPYAQLALSTSVLMKDMKVVDIYTTTNEESSSQGAMTLTCEVNGVRISVRTAVLKDSNGNLITEKAFMGKTISVEGVVDYYMGGYQIRVLTMDHITIEE
jgi:endonuclease YncB( thermonuclease family)